ncbi:MAG: ferric reductase-like transmembrane domain-containing protein [Thermoleophilia bacterium]
MTLDMLPWVISRATGISAILALTAAMIAGLLVRTREPLGTMRGAPLVNLHRVFSATALVLIGVHGTALLFDTTEPVTPLQLLVPGLTDYRPVWTALGVIAAELALVIHLSFRWRGKLGNTFWRRLHFGTYLVFVLGIAHGIGAGTDADTTWALALYGGSVAGVFALTAWRASTARRGRPATRPGAGSQSPRPPRRPAGSGPRPVRNRPPGPRPVRSPLAGPRRPPRLARRAAPQRRPRRRLPRSRRRHVPDRRLLARRR